MPIIWNAQADAQLLSAIIKVYDVKVSGEKLNEVAKIMGQGCTAKALTHRLSKIRAMAKENEAQAGGAGTNGTTMTPKKSRAPAKSPGKSGGGRKEKAASITPSPDGDRDDEEDETSARAARPKRTTPKRNYAQMAGEDSDLGEDDEGDGLDKKVKIEVGEDIGGGLRAADEDSDANFS